MKWITEAVDSFVKFGEFFIKLSAEKTVNLILIFACIILAYWGFATNDDLKALQKEKDVKQSDYVALVLECEARMRLQAEAQTRVHNEFRDRTEIENQNRIRDWKARFDSQQAELQSAMKKQIETERIIDKILKK